MISEKEITQCEKQLKRYFQKKDIYDGIINFINKAFNKEYDFYGDEKPLSAIGKEQRLEKVKCDLFFGSISRNSVILVEETRNDIINKKTQFKKYLNLDRQNLQSIMGTDVEPSYVDLFYIVPNNLVSVVKESFRRIIEEKDIFGSIPRKIGVTFWCYNKEINKFRRFEGDFQCNFLKHLNPQKIEIENINCYPIYQIAPPIAILLHLIQCSLELFGREEVIIDNDFIKKHLYKYGIRNDKKIKKSLVLGKELGLLEDVNASPGSYYAKLVYHKKHQSTYRKINRFLSNPIKFMRDLKEGKQTDEDLEEYDPHQSTLDDFPF